MALWWFVTWSTYGSWLPGDPRGFQTWRGKEYVPPPKRYAKPGEPTYDPERYRERWQQAKALCPQAVMLTQEEKQLALAAFVEEISELPLNPRIISVGDWHVHFIAQFGALKIRPTVGRLKSAATRALPNPGDRKRVWTDACHMKSLPTATAFDNGVSYVRRHEDEGALVFEW